MHADTSMLAAHPWRQAVRTLEVCALFELFELFDVIEVFGYYKRLHGFNGCDDSTV